MGQHRYADNRRKIFTASLQAAQGPSRRKSTSCAAPRSERTRYGTAAWPSTKTLRGTVATALTVTSRSRVDRDRRFADHQPAPFGLRSPMR